MASGVLLSDPNLEVITIDDFTPGVQRFSRGGYRPTFHRRDGSASSAFRCYAVAELGLCPFPRYSTPGYTPLTSLANNGTSDWTAICSMVSLGAEQSGALETVLVSVLQRADILNASFVIKALLSPPLAINTTPYTSAGTATGNKQMSFNNMVAYFTIDSTIYNVVGLTVDPMFGVNDQLTWVTVPAWDSTSVNHRTGTVTIAAGGVPVEIAQVLQQTDRAAIMAPTGLSGAGAIGPFTQTGFYVSNIEAVSGFTGPSFFTPSNSNLVGAWGSVSTGELFVVNQGPGASVVTGDLLAPSSVISLPAVTGTGTARGPAIPTPIGLVYVTDFDGAYLWNGGNTSQKISLQIPDDQFTRSQVPSAIIPYPGINPCTTHHDVWNNWVMFANNWMYDCLTNSWWQVEDPAIHNFQVHTGSHMSSRWFYSADGFTTTAHADLFGYWWDYTEPSTSYIWVSNPIGIPGSVVSLQMVEILASNPTSTPATITISPTSPPGQSLYGNQNPVQQAVFTIPPLTSNFRGSLRLGYLDYNVCIRVDAANTDVAGAPILHELTYGIDRRPSAVR